MVQDIGGTGKKQVQGIGSAVARQVVVHHFDSVIAAPAARHIVAISACVVTKLMMDRPCRVQALQYRVAGNTKNETGLRVILCQLHQFDAGKVPIPTQQDASFPPVTT